MLLILVIATLPLVTFAKELPIEDDDVLLEHNAGSERIVKHLKEEKYSVFHNFDEDQLIELNQAVRHLVLMVEANEKTMKTLIDNISRFMQKPKLPKRIEVDQQISRTGEDEVHDNPISRRFYSRKPLMNNADPSFSSNIDIPNFWCSAAILCPRTVVPVCGYDHKFGYGTFDNFCHMLQVNCYLNYDFSIAPSCKPIL